MFAMTDKNLEYTIPDKKTMLLHLSNEIDIFRLAVQGPDVDPETFLRISRTMLTLVDVLVMHTSASAKGKNTAREMLMELKQHEMVNDCYHLPLTLISRLDWLMEYVNDKSDEFTAQQLHDRMVRVKALTYMGGPAA